MTAERKQPGSGKRKAKQLRAARVAKVVEPKQSRRDKMIADGSLIVANLSKQASNNSYCPPLEYRDTEFNCRDCGRKETWTAKQQQWWYEVAKGSIYSGARRCRDCRRIDRLVKQAAQWPLARKPIVIVMDLDDSRVRLLKQVLQEFAPELVPVSKLITIGWDGGFFEVFPGSRFLSLGTNWLSLQEQKHESHGGFLKFLLSMRPRRPIILHGAKTEASHAACESLQKARWKVVEVENRKNDWIESDWRNAVSSLLKLKSAG